MSKSKQKTNALPSVSTPTTNVVKPTTTTKQVKFEMTLTQPIAMPAKLDRLRMDIRPLSRKQRYGMMILTGSLVQQQKTLTNGMKIRTPAQSVRRVFEDIADQFGFDAEK